jgi:hypothetical protein
MANVPHSPECLCPNCVAVRDSQPPPLEGLSYLNKTCIMKVVSVERDAHGHWSVNVNAVPRKGYEHYFAGREPKLDKWLVEMWNRQVRLHKGNR